MTQVLEGGAQASVRALGQGILCNECPVQLAWVPDVHIS